MVDPNDPPQFIDLDTPTSAAAAAQEIKKEFEWEKRVGDYQLIAGSLSVTDIQQIVNPTNPPEFIDLITPTATAVGYPRHTPSTPQYSPLTPIRENALLSVEREQVPKRKKQRSVAPSDRITRLMQRERSTE